MFLTDLVRLVVETNRKNFLEKWAFLFSPSESLTAKTDGLSEWTFNHCLLAHPPENSLVSDRESTIQKDIPYLVSRMSKTLPFQDFNSLGSIFYKMGRGD